MSMSSQCLPEATASRAAVFSAALLAMLIAASTCQAADDAKWETIFNGKDLSGWVAEGSATRRDGESTAPIWTVTDGHVHCSGTPGTFGFLRYDRRVCDFAFRAEYRLEKGTNSGIGIRTVPYRGVRQTRPSFASYEIQLLDDAGKPPDEHSTASLYRYVAPTENASKPAGEWQTIEIECIGPKIVIQVNGRKVQDVDQSKVAEIKDKPLCGYVCLQNHGSPITFRNLQLRVIKAAE